MTDPLGICVSYDYVGDEAKWESVVSGFVSSIQADQDLAGRFSYTIQKAREGSARIHVGRWDTPETVALLQSRDYFKTFSANLKELAGDSLRPVAFQVTHHT